MATIAWNQPDPGQFRPGFELPNTQAILNAQNNYWMVNFNSGLALDDKTDLNLDYTYYQADNYSDLNPMYISYGAGGEAHAITATEVRRLTKNLRAIRQRDRSAVGNRAHAFLQSFLRGGRIRSGRIRDALRR